MGQAARLCRRAGLAATMGLAACALFPACSTYRIPLPSKSMASGLLGGDQRRIHVATPFGDERPHYDECDEKAAVPRLQCSPEAPEWFATQLEQALQSAGFQLVQEANQLGLDDPRIDGALLRFAVENRPGFSEVTSEADAHVRLEIRTESGLSAERSFYVKGSRASSVATSQTMQREAVDDVSQRIFRDVVAAVLSLMNRYPEVGRAVPSGRAPEPEQPLP